MSCQFLDPPLKPRNGNTLRVICISRISRETQNEKSLDDQEALLRQWVADHYDGPVEWHIIAGQGSGEVVKREEVIEAELLVATEQYDLVIMEDLGRHERRVQAFGFCEDCEDAQTRLIAINDGIDTAHEWRLGAIFTSMRHELYNADTAARIRRTQRNRFTQGGIIARPIFGYILQPVKNPMESDLQKDPAAEPIYDEWFRRLEDGATYSEIADWLNAKNIPVGRYCRSKKWKCATVGQVTRNPILRGLRVRNRRMSKRVNSSGKRKSIKAPPADLLTRECPHLAFIEPARYDRVLHLLDQRNGKYSRGRYKARDSRQGVPRKRTIWPGQSIYCGVCGRVFYYGGHGRNDHLMCSGCREYACWNSVAVSGPLTADRLCTAIWDKIEQLPEFDAAFLIEMQNELDHRNASFDAEKSRLDRNLARLERELANILAAIRVGGQMASLVAELGDIEHQIADAKLQGELLLQSVRDTPRMPSAEEIKSAAARIFREMPRDTPDFGREMNRLIPRLEVFPYRLYDCNRIVLRAKFILDLPALLARPSDWQSAPSGVLHLPMTVDIFESPQRVVHLVRVIEMTTNSTLREQDIAAELCITKAAVNRTKKLWRQMQQAGLTDPYIVMTEPPTEGKIRRYRHPRYHFDPLPAL